MRHTIHRPAGNQVELRGVTSRPFDPECQVSKGGVTLSKRGRDTQGLRVGASISNFKPYRHIIYIRQLFNW